jgi:hypothetical protein
VTKKEGKKIFFNKITKEKKITKITKIKQERGKTERRSKVRVYIKKQKTYHNKTINNHVITCYDTE